MFSQIISAIAAIPKLIEAIENLMALFKAMDLERRLEKVEQAFIKLEQSKTFQEKQDAAKSIQDSIRG